MGTSSARDAGFTLIEMLVVILLMGLALGVGLTLDFAGSPQNQEQQVQVFANELELAGQEAVLDGALWGLDFFVLAQGDSQQTGYRWLRQEEQRWVEIAVPGSEAMQTLFQAGNNVELSISAQSVQPEEQVDLAALAEENSFAPEIVLLPTREITPFSVRLRDEDGNESVVTADLLGRVWVNEDVPQPP